jgi:hypothetical protein
MRWAQVKPELAKSLDGASVENSPRLSLPGNLGLSALYYFRDRIESLR